MGVLTDRQYLLTEKEIALLVSLKKMQNMFSSEYHHRIHIGDSSSSFKSFSFDFYFRTLSILIGRITPHCEFCATKMAPFDFSL